jgi:hypothetical protein
MKITNDDIEPIRFPYRVIAAFGVLFGLFGLILMFLLSYQEQTLIYIFFGVIVFGVCIYIMMLPTVTGYPPKFLYFACQRKKNSI